MPKFGVDVSTWQSGVDYKKAVKEGGVEFVIVRASFGWSAGQKDNQFENHYAGFKAQGIPMGAYHYSYASSVEDMKKEVAFFLECVKGKTFELPFFIDIEDNAQRSASRRELTEMVKTWCEGIKAAGHIPGIYTGYYWLRDSMYADEIVPKYDLWIASWGTDRPTEYENAMWQFGGSTNYLRNTNVAGFDGAVDQNYLYKDYGVAEKPKEEEIKPSEPALTEIVYTVKAGDTLSGIAAKYGTTWPLLAEYNHLDNPDLIYAGDKIKIPGGEGKSEEKKKETVYTVKAGDTLSEIAAKYGTDYMTLAKINGIENPDLIFAGQKIKIP